MTLVFVQENLKRCDAPSSLTFLAKLAHICQCGVRPDEQDTLTDWRTSCHFDDFAVLPSAFPFFLLHGTTSLFLDHLFDIVIVRLQVGVAEAGVYPLLVVGREFRHNVDFGLTDITHVLGCSPVMSPT